MAEEKASRSLCGLWVDREGVAHAAWADGAGKRAESKVEFRPFLWAMGARMAAPPDTVLVEELKGSGDYDRLLTFGTLDDYQSYLKAGRQGASIDWIRQLEHQCLMQNRLRLFGDMPFLDLRRMQLDIETACSVEGGFSDAMRAEDRVLAIGLRCGGQVKMLTLESMDDEGERRLLKELNKTIASWDPDTVEGHNIFKFDFDYLRKRGKRLKVPCRWGRFGQTASFRTSRMRVAERRVDYLRCDLPGRSVIDTYLLIQLYDITTRELMSYALKEVARYLGITPMDGGDRVYIEGHRIQEMFADDRERFLGYLADDLRETEGVADRLLPTYFEQAKAFPTLLQEACLRGTASKVDLVFQEEYYHRKAACPAPRDVPAFAGGYTASFRDGVFRKVLHFDVASLYPSLLLLIGRNPETDTEGVFIPMLKRLREYRLRYKKLARETDDPVMASEYSARQSSFKILINSFYGYLGFSGARFGDAELASEVTAKGRDLLKSLIAFFEEEDGCVPIEADTDGIYVASPKHFDDPGVLLAKAQEGLPEGIDLEYDGKYEAMFSYKSKNYALYDGEKVVVRGSGLRSRGMEPYLKALTMDLIAFVLGASEEDPADKAAEMEEALREGAMPVEEIAKSEVLSQSPQKYREKIEAGGKPRRASLEVALKMDPSPRMGDRVAYFIGPKEKGQTADWQRAWPVERFEAGALAYDASYYIKKLNDWRKRYAPFHPKLKENPRQGRLL